MVERAGGVDGKQKIGSDNKGNKMLQKMGWKDGQGLGKKNQGRTEIVEVCKLEFTLVVLGYIGNGYCDNFLWPHQCHSKRDLYLVSAYKQTIVLSVSGRWSGQQGRPREQGHLQVFESEHGVQGRRQTDSVAEIPDRRLSLVD